VVSIKYSYDERIADGIYCAKALNLFKAFVENPSRLLTAPGPGGAP